MHRAVRRAIASTQASPSWRQSTNTLGEMRLGIRGFISGGVITSPLPSPGRRLICATRNHRRENHFANHRCRRGAQTALFASRRFSGSAVRRDEHRCVVQQLARRMRGCFPSAIVAVKRHALARHFHMRAGWRYGRYALRLGRITV